MSSQEPVRRYTRATRSRRGGIIDVDLNAAPPSESRSQEDSGTSTRANVRAAAVEGGTAQPRPIDVEAFDDDVVISSPRAFAEAKNNPRRIRRRNIVVDVESEERASCNKRRRIPANETVVNCDIIVNLEGKKGSKNDILEPAPAPLPPPKELVLSCPICMGPLVEEMTTKCGHIFCKNCIKTAIATQPKCPTCRKRTTSKDIIRIYLPATR